MSHGIHFQYAHPTVGNSSNRATGQLRHKLNRKLCQMEILFNMLIRQSKIPDSHTHICHTALLYYSAKITPKLSTILAINEHRKLHNSKGMFLYSSVSSPLDRSKCFTQPSELRRRGANKNYQVTKTTPVPG